MMWESSEKERHFIVEDISATLVSLCPRKKKNSTVALHIYDVIIWCRNFSFWCRIFSIIINIFFFVDFFSWGNEFYIISLDIK